MPNKLSKTKQFNPNGSTDIQTLLFQISSGQILVASNKRRFPQAKLVSATRKLLQSHLLETEAHSGSNKLLAL